MNKHRIEVKEYLAQAFGLDARIRVLQDEIAKLHAQAEMMPVLYSKQPKCPNRNCSGMEDAVVEFVDLETELKDKLILLTTLKKNIIRCIQNLDDKDLRLVLALRYLSYKRWEDIAEDMACGLANVYRLHRIALDSVKIPKS